MKPHYIAKPVYQNGCQVAWNLYTRTGLFGQLSFARRMWL